MKITPNYISSLKFNEVFTYGANEAGRHGAGAAKTALKWGAIYGEYGFNGQTYGIPTKNSKIQTLPLDAIEKHVKDFLTFATEHPSLEFLTTEIGTGLAGYKVTDIAPLFFKFEIPDNVSLPESFWKYRNEN